MPYKVVGSSVMHFKEGKWSTKQKCSSPENAKAAIRLLEGVEHGWTPGQGDRGKVRRRRGK